MTGWVALPVAMSWSAVPAWSIGIANPDRWCRPRSPVAGHPGDGELTPMTWPVESTSGPPELPGLIAASVWMALM